MHEDLGVRLRVKPVATPLQFLSQVGIIEDLAVVNDPDGLVFVVNGLITPGQVEDAQPCRAEPNLFVTIDSEGIGAAVSDEPQHTAEEMFLLCGGSMVDDSGYATHFGLWPNRPSPIMNFEF